MRRALIVAVALLAAAAPLRAQDSAGSELSATVRTLLANARLWQSLGRPDHQRRVLEKLLALDGLQPQALVMLGELALREGRIDEAQDLLSRLARGAPGPARELEDLLRLYTRDRERLAELRRLRSSGQVARARTLARALFPGGQLPQVLAAEFAPLLAADRAVAQAPPPVPAPLATDPVPGAEARAAALWPQVRALRDAGQLDAAEARLAEALELQPEAWEGRLLAAELAARRGRYAVAEAAYRGLLALPAGPETAAPAAAGLVAVLQAQGRHEDALVEAERGQTLAALDLDAVRAAAAERAAVGAVEGARQLLARAVALAPSHPWLRHDLARLQLAHGDAISAEATMADGLARTPMSDEMRFAAALVRVAAGDEAAAQTLIDDVAESRRSADMHALAERLRQSRQRREAAQVAEAERQAQRLREWEAQEALRQPIEEAGWVPFSRRADDGLSTLKGVVLPVRITRPAAAGTERWWQVEGVALDAGDLPADFSASAPFARVRALGVGLGAPLAQRARGLTLALGAQGAGQRWDVGLVGAGFEVPNLVGGWRAARRWGGQDMAFAVSRRVLTSSLLAHAGTRDPVRGERWGGVTLNAIDLDANRRIGPWNAALGLRVGHLSGHRVAGNDTRQLRLAAERDWIDTPALQLSAGLSLAAWHYRRNLGFHSFGHGGYYSPQRYLNLGVPLRAQGWLGAGWTYRVRASLAHTRSDEAPAPYYPTDAALQAASGDPQHAGAGRRSGSAHSLRIELERRLAPHWQFGAALQVDRSPDYAPTQWLLYLRRSHKPQPAEGVLPRPLVPYGRD